MFAQLLADCKTWQPKHQLSRPLVGVFPINEEPRRTQAQLKRYEISRVPRATYMLQGYWKGHLLSLKRC